MIYSMLRYTILIIFRILMYPFSLWILLFVVIVLTSLEVRQNNIVSPDGKVYKRDIGPFIFTAITILLMAYFTGNTVANDVYLYRFSFSSLSTDISWNELYKMGTGSNPLFRFIEVLFKRYISGDPASFHLFEGLVAQTCFILFFRRYSPSLSMSLFMFITSGLFYFTMVSWKQSFAMGIGLMGIPLIQQKNYIYYFTLLAITMLIHPYIIMYVFLPVLINEKVWTKKNIIILTVMVLTGFSLSKILGSTLEFTETVFGDRHDAQWFTEENGVSFQRIIFFAITPVLSFIYRKRIDAQPIPLMNGFIQMSVISFGFMLISMWGGANFISRMGTYFEPFTYVALPYILLCVVPENRKSFFKYSVLILFLIFFCFLQLKRGSLF